MVSKGVIPSADDRDPRGERLGEAGLGAPLPDDVSDSRSRWHALVHVALVALPYVLGILVPVLLLALLHWLS